MAIQSIFLIISLAVLTVNSVSPTNTDSQPCPDATCGLESSPWSPGGYFGRRVGLDNVRQCLDFCKLPRRWGDCKSFTFESDSGTCWIHEMPAKDGTADPGSGDTLWDTECDACGLIPTTTTTSPTATPTCLSPTAICEVEAVLRSGEEADSYGRGEGITYPYACWELCNDPRRPPRCESFTWNPDTQTCLLYDKSAVVTHEVSPGSGTWLWDKGCWTCGVSGYT